MDQPFEPARLSEWLRSIAATEDHEVDCDAMMEAAEQLVAAGTRGDDLRAVLPDLRYTSTIAPTVGGGMKRWSP